jgi:hypothetical protein
VIDSPTAGIFTSMGMGKNYPASAGLIRASRSSDVSSTIAPVRPASRN